MKMDGKDNLENFRKSSGNVQKMNPVDELKRTRPAIASPMKGLLIVLASGLIMSGVSLLVQDTPNIHPAQHSICRFWVYASTSLPYLIFQQENIFGPSAHRMTILFAAVINASTLILYFVALKYLPLGEAAVLYSSCPAFATIGGRIFLKEKFGILQISAVLMIVVGVIFTTGLNKTVADPSRVFSTENVYGIASALAAALTTGAMCIFLRKLRNVHASVIMFNTGIVGIIGSLILTECTGGFNLPVGDLQRVSILLIGFLSTLGFLCGVVACKYLEAGPVSAARASLEIFFSFLWQVSIFGNVPNGLTILGPVLVCFSVILIGFNQWISKFLSEKLRKLC